MATNKNSSERLGKVYSYMRWSSAPQTWGDSERRQEQLARDWCSRNGKTLCEKTFTDRGISGWHGDNRKNGALGALLKEVKPGDTILVEDTDRWSREHPLDSLNAIRQTIDQGVEIAFLTSGVVVNKNNFSDPTTLFPLFFGSYMANSENERRAFRIRQAMNARRERIKQGFSVRGSMPCWLHWDEKLRTVVVSEEKAATVKKLFEMSLNGIGVGSMLGKLMRAGTPCPSRGERAKWNTRLIHRILCDKAVIGHHVPTGTPGVFPPIVSDEVFYRSISMLKARRRFTAPVKYSNGNLFTGLCRCSKCLSTLIKIASGHDGKKRYDYLACSDGVKNWKDDRCASRNAGIAYGQFERSFLTLILRADLIRGLICASHQPNCHLEALKGKLADVQMECEKYLRLIEADEEPPRRILEKLKTLETREADLHKQIEMEEVNTRATAPVDQSYERFIEDFGNHLSEPEYRAKIRHALREIVETIVVDLDEKSYDLNLKGGKTSVTVLVRRNGFIISPAPSVLR